MTKSIAVVISILVALVTNALSFPFAWRWGAAAPVATNEDDKSMVEGNSPAIAEGDDKCLTGWMEETEAGYYVVNSAEATRELTPAWVTSDVFRTLDSSADAPCFAYTSSRKHAVWPIWDLDNILHILHKDGPDDAAGSWDNEPHVLFEGFGPGDDGSMTMATSGDTVGVAIAYHEPSEGAYDVMFNRSTNQGEDWLLAYQWPYGSASANDPIPYVAFGMSSGCYYHFAWTEHVSASGTDELRYLRNTDGGTWPSPTTLVTGVDITYAPCIATIGHFIYISYGDDGTPNSLILRSTDDGASWTEAAVRLPSRYPVGDVPTYGSARLWVFPRWDGRNVLVVGAALEANSELYQSIRTVDDFSPQFPLEREAAFLVEPEVVSLTGRLSAGSNPQWVVRTAYLDGDEQLTYRGGYYALDLEPISIPVDGRGGLPRIAIDRSANCVYLASDFIQVDTVVGLRCLSSIPDTWHYSGRGEYSEITLGSGGVPWISYARHDTLFAAQLNSDSDWTFVNVFAAPSGWHIGPPSLSVFQTGADRVANLAFATYDPTAGHSAILYAQLDTTVVKLDTIDLNVTDLSDSTPVISVGSTDSVFVSYQTGSSNVVYRTLVYPSNTFGQPDTWSSAVQVNDESTTARHPFCEKIGGRLYVSFTQTVLDEGDNLIYSIQRTSCSTAVAVVTWEGMEAVSVANTSIKDWSGLSTKDVVVWSESSGTHWQIMANVRDSIFALTSADSNSKYASVLADTSEQSTPSSIVTTIRCLWSQQTNGDTWAVRYSTLDVHSSNAGANATQYETGRKIILDEGDLHSVYRTNQGSLYYSKMTDAEGGWNSSILRSTGRYPAVSADYLHRLWVGDKDQISGPMGTYDYIRCQNRASGSPTWTDFAVYPTGTGLPSTTKFGPVSIAACPNDTGGLNRSCGYLVWPMYEAAGQGTKSKIVMAKVSTTGRVYLDTLHSVSDASDSFPSISVYEVGANGGYALSVAWQNGTEVYYKKTTNQDQPQFTTKRTWSGDYNLSNTQALSKHPMIAASNDTVLVAWIEGDGSGRVLVRGQNEDAGYNNWADTVNVSLCPDTCTDYPTITIGDSIIIVYQKVLAVTNSDITACVNFHTNLSITNSSTNSTYPHCAFELHDGTTPMIHSVWTEDLSPNYAEVGYKGWEIGQEGGGGSQSAGVVGTGIEPMLFSAAPNPFNRTTAVRYQTGRACRTRIEVIDVTGRRVRTLVDAVTEPGIYSQTWDGTDNYRRSVPEGIYFVRMRLPDFQQTRKVILSR